MGVQAIPWLGARPPFRKSPPMHDIRWIRDNAEVLKA
jgi:hypothetical protein